jgi:SAM-dependent methyltransferase
MNNHDYWNLRWSDIPVDEAMINRDSYPLKYALETVQAKDGPILEAGCGAGRVLRFFHEYGYDIVGIDFVETVISKLLEVDPSLKVTRGDITKLTFLDNSFRYVLAFGLFHNLQHGLDDAVNESFRVLERGGRLCASFRADNLQTRLTDWHAARQAHRKSATNELGFHKLNLSRNEFASLIQRAGFAIESIKPVQNMPLLYKFAVLRARDQRVFNENRARSEGYQLSPFGKWLQTWLMRMFPNEFCNVYVLIARKP